MKTHSPRAPKRRTPPKTPRPKAARPAGLAARNSSESPRAETATRRRVDEFSALYDTALELSSQHDLPALLKTIVRRAQSLVGASSGGIYLFDAARAELELAVTQGNPAPAGTRLQIGEGMAGRVAQSREPLIVGDYSTWEFRSAQYREVNFHSVLQVPMLYGGELIGVLSVTDERVQNRFAENDARLLSLLASQAAGAVHAARLLAETQQRAQQLAALVETTRDLASQTELSTLLETIVERATTLLGAPRGTLYLYDAARNRLESVVQKGRIGPVPARLQKGEGFAGKIALTRQPLIVENYSQWEGRSPQYQGMKLNAILGVPMLYGGELIGVLTVSEINNPARRFSEADARLLSLFAGQAASAVHNARLFQETRARANQLAMLYDAGLTLNRVLDLDVQLEFLLQTAMRAVRADRAEFFERDALRAQIKFRLGAGYAPAVLEKLRASDFFSQPDGLGNWIVQNRLPLNLPDVSADPRYVPLDPDIRAGLWVPILHEDQLRGILGVFSERLHAFAPSDERLLILFANQLAVAMENARLYTQERQRVQELTRLNQISATINQPLALTEVLQSTLRELVRALDVDRAAIATFDDARQHLTLIAEFNAHAGPSALGEKIPLAGNPSMEFILRERQPLAVAEIENEPLVAAVAPLLQQVGVQSILIVPLIVRDEIVGTIGLDAIRARRVFSRPEIELAQTIANQAAAAIERARLLEQTQRRVEHLQALRTIDAAINSSLDLKLTLGILLEQAAFNLRMDAAAILQLDPQTQRLDYSAAKGFRTNLITRSDLPLGEGLAGRAALERRVIRIANLRDQPGILQRKLFAAEGFAAYFAAPLVVKGRVKGVLEFFHRTPFQPDNDWIELMESLAGQAGIAVENAELFENLQRSNLELALAYDATIEGWSRALELRAQEPPGHSERVTARTIELARAVGIAEAELAAARRGARLHDIGKMGIPDSILLKPGPLTEAEWKIMRAHPQHAWNLLSPILFLRPAIAIPYCHQERWDGSGYPRGLRGEAIPLAARVFAVVDVWEALTSDRPYRPAWDADKARGYLREQAGTLFDPAIVEKFLALSRAAETAT